MATYLEICKAVRAQAGISGEGPTNVTGQTGIYADVVRWVDEAYNEIQSLHENWNFLFLDGGFILPADTIRIPAIESYAVRQFDKQSFTITFQDEDRERLIYRPWAEFKNTSAFLAGTSDTGKPEWITERPDGNLQFYPVPEEDYIIGYIGYSRPYTMVNSTDEPIFAAQYHDLIKLKALMKYGEYYNSQEVLRSADVNYRILLSKMQFSELPKDNIRTPPLVRFA